MAFELTEKALLASERNDIKPNIALVIEGISTVFGAVNIEKIARYGEDSITYGLADLFYGGTVPIEDQKEYISFSGGTSTEIRQTLQQDKGVAESVSNMTVALIDQNNEITNIIAPGNVVPDINGRRCKVYFGFDGTAYPDDYIIIFRGIVQSTESLPGLVRMNLSHPDQKKRSTIFNPASSALSGAMGSGDTVSNVTSSADFLARITGPDGSTIDGDFRTYLKIDSEIMEYQSISGNQFQTLTRGVLGTTAAAHSSGATVESFYRVGGSTSNAIELSLKMMLSGENTFQFDNIIITNFVRISASSSVANAIFFSNRDIIEETNVQVGDFIETTGATNGANNVSPSTTIKVSDIVIVEGVGSYIVVGGVSFVEEVATSALLKIRSQYDVWPDGLRMKMDEVDISEHDDIKNTFVVDFSLDFYLVDEINGKEFISQQIYDPVGCFSLPRKSQASLGIHVPPLPNENIISLDIDNVVDPKAIKIQRSTNKNIINTILYKYETLATDPDTFTQTTLSLDSAAISQLNVGRRSKVIEAQGMRTALSAEARATATASRRLKNIQKVLSF